MSAVIRSEDRQRVPRVGAPLTTATRTGSESFPSNWSRNRLDGARAIAFVPSTPILRSPDGQCLSHLGLHQMP